MKKWIWISYDLGVRGDYEGLYAWLDRHGAKECGESVAFLRYEHTGSLHKALEKDLASAIEVNKRTRVYVISSEGGKIKTMGVFLFGSRRAAPWTGLGGVKKKAEDRA